MGSDSDDDFHDAITGTTRNTGDTDVIQEHHVLIGEASLLDDDHTAEPAHPEHPLASMQGAFEESILESALPPPPRSRRTNAEIRRQKLLDSKRFDETWISRWKQRPEAEYHPLLKLVSQITFGMHLLQQNQAKSDQEVVRILQTHVDEVDDFLERTTEDFDLAIKDVEERIQFLQLPMKHMKVFDIMLDDITFRAQLLSGNEKIERLIHRTAGEMNAALLDVQKGKQATRELGKYLNHVQDTWPSERADLEAIYLAMRGNEEGWKTCLKDIQAKGNALGSSLIELGTVIGEMSNMASVASKRSVTNRPRSSGNSSVTSSTVLKSRYNVDMHRQYANTPLKDKPLPHAPTFREKGTFIPSTQPKSFQRSEAHRDSSKADPPTLDKPVRSSIGPSERPKTSSGHERSRTDNLGGLRSHPPDQQRPKSAGNSGGRSKSLTQSSSETKKLLRDASQSPGTIAKTGKENRESMFTSKKSLLDRSSFVRRWSSHRSSSVPKGEDAIDKRVSRPTVQYNHMTTVAEQALADGVSNERKGTGIPATKSSTGSFGFIRMGFDKSHASPDRSDSVHTGAESVSIASSIKRRTLSVKDILTRKLRRGV